MSRFIIVALPQTVLLIMGYELVSTFSKPEAHLIMGIITGMCSAVIGFVLIAITEPEKKFNLGKRND